MSNTSDPKHFLHKLLQLVISHKASDLFITVGFVPALKIDGDLQLVGQHKLSESEVQTLLESMLTNKQKKVFDETHELNFAYEAENIGRFRVSIMYQKGRSAAVLRRIPTEIPTIQSLQLPSVLEKVVTAKRGLILMVGATGAGKSTTLASMLNYRSGAQTGHIITIEDPIEFILEHQLSIVHQREVGMDTESWGVALKNSLRQAPDVIMIGEIRDRETMEHAITFAETGHLCMATLHANNAYQALDRIIHFFPDDKRPQLLLDLSFNLKAVISQRLLPIVNSKGRIAAVEILLQSPYISDLIGNGQIWDIKEVMEKSNDVGMQTFDQALFKLFDNGLISEENALRFADSSNNVELNIRTRSKQAKEQLATMDTSGLSLSEKQTPGQEGRRL